MKVSVCLYRPVIAHYPHRGSQAAADLVRIPVENAQPPGAPESLRACAPDRCRHQSLRGAEWLCGAFSDPKDSAAVNARPPARPTRGQPV
jgi:hypothetical protein